MELRSPAFEPGGQIPEKYSRDRDSISPPLEWSDVAAAAKELALLMENVSGAPTAQWIL